MYNFFDYLNFYKNKTIQETNWNVIDNLLCAILTYLPGTSYVGGKSFEEFYCYSKQFQQRTKENAMVPYVYKILDIIKDSSRYKEMCISNFQVIRTEKVQFGAATFTLGDNSVIAYMGTDYSIIGWLEDFKISCEYPTVTHELAIEYLKSNAKTIKSKRLYICGHSKGGNLAIVAAMESSDKLFKRITKVYNFDGPGVRKEEFVQDKFKRLENKLVNVIPSGSIVGILLNNFDYTVVKSSEIGIAEHYPTSWSLFGECFIEENLSTVSKTLHQVTVDVFENISYEEIKEVIEVVFESFCVDYTSNVKFSIDDVVRTYKNIKKSDNNVRKTIENIIGTMIDAGFENLKSLNKQLIGDEKNQNNY